MMDAMDKSFLLNKLYVSNYSFVVSPTYSVEEDASDRIPATLMHRYEKIDNDHARVEIRVVLGAKKKSPYSFELVFGGIFEEKEYDEDPINKDALVETALAVLFPYVRALTTSLTSMSGVNGYVLPVINVHKFFAGKATKGKK